MGRNDEKVLNVPLKPNVRRRLDDRADANGRAASREAANIIERAVMPAKGASNGRPDAYTVKRTGDARPPYGNGGQFVKKGGRR